MTDAQALAIAVIALSTVVSIIVMAILLTR
jgi:hypothetical protein